MRKSNLQDCLSPQGRVSESDRKGVRKGFTRIIAHFRFLPASGRRLARTQAPVKWNCFAENFDARQKLAKRETAALVCLYDFALNDFASAPAPLASEDAALPPGNE